jgi:hypothetical protein
MVVDRLMESVRKIMGGKIMAKKKGKQYRYGRIVEKTMDEITYTLHENPECELINIQSRFSIHGWEYVAFYKRLLKKGEELDER